MYTNSRENYEHIAHMKYKLIIKYGIIIKK